jgi:pilus assembly protein CpaC
MENTGKTDPRRTGRRRTGRLLLAGALAGLSLLVYAGSSFGQQDPMPAAAPATRPAAAQGAAAQHNGADLIQQGLDENGQIRLTANKSVVLTVRGRYDRVSIGQPQVADVNMIGPSNILVTGKQPGTTQMIIWDDQNRSQVVDVTVAFDLQALQEQLRTMFPNSKIEATSVGNAVALRGQVPNLQTAEQAVAVATPFAERVLNFLEISGGQQVMLQVRFAEVSRSATNALGVNLGFTDGTTFGASNVGQVNPFGVDGGGLASSPVNPAVTVFGRAAFGNITLDFFINALRQNNLLRVLAEPNLIAMSGQEANFLAGGEFPIPVTQGGGAGAGGIAITVEYREFGVRLKMIPVVLGDGRIRLKVAPEVSDLDFTTAVRFNGFVVPGLTSRRVETTVELAEGQTFAIAGLLNNSVTATKDVTPVLGDLPVLGALFRSVRYQRKETELVVLVTPRLVEALNPADVPTLPGEHWRDPNEADLFLNRDLGGEVKPMSAEESMAGLPPEARTAPRFKGDYGFVPSTQPVADAFGGPVHP